MKSTTFPATAWLYLASAAFSNFGNAVATLVWPWLVLQRTGDPAAAGLVATLIGIPTVVVAIVGGHLIDTVGRKPMSVISDVISASSIVAVIAVDQYWDLNLWWLVIIGIYGAVGDIPGFAARNALMGDVAASSGKSLEWVAGIMQAITGVSFLLGPALGGILMASLPLTSVLWITAGCSLFAAVLTFALRLTATGSSEEEEQQVFSGWRAWTAVLKSAPVRMMAIINGIAEILVIPYLLIFLPAHFESINAPASLGATMSGFAVGLMVGGVISAKMDSLSPLQRWWIGMGLYTLAFAGMAVLHVTWIVIVGMVLAGLGSGFVTPLQNVFITESVPEQLRGRAFSLMGAINLLAQPVGLAAATVALGFASIYSLAVVCAVLWASGALWASVEGKRVL
ncbi:MFS transporter [Corynebacterium felinum]|uniref:MFS family permease n=2 Tax=Corynebacterium felinum TaxID=131318 RepID=A0ABU2BAI4_9CORY|nr:MFS transporter [Corynebacterium felinum]MDF5821820.1 MFS transporter [Corynebacterium felinum]MDR7355371.1 MFS family permease [Corynebacterium felinum]WJY94723.1 putative multidrug-efflux transporter [Corynebacterium felinum]